jgi:hypothetical protein
MKRNWLVCFVVLLAVGLLVLRVDGAPRLLGWEATPAPDGVVRADVRGLRLRASPGTAGVIVAHLDALAPLSVTGRAGPPSDVWLQVVTAQGQQGWVSKQYVLLYVDLAAVPETGAGVVNLTGAPERSTAMPRGLISGITDNARRIFLNGQALGNRANVFSKVGDSITAAGYFLFPIGWGQYNLREYGYLLPAVEHFSAGSVSGTNSFANNSIAAANAWTTADVLDPINARPDVCEPGETPLECEYRVIRPAAALIMIGTNDMMLLPFEDYQANLAQIVELSIERGVLPVLSTLPPHAGMDEQVQAYNQFIADMAHGYGVPLWDYWLAMENLPGRGLSLDGIHPSWPPGDDITAAADFTAENLQFGYTMRNLTALQVLDVLWRQALY